MDNKFFLLLVNFLWMVGLFGTLFTIVYTLQYRRKRWWNVGHSNNVPRTLVPLYLALATLCFGLMLHAYMAANLVGIGVAAVWALLALLFVSRCFITLGSAVQAGWDEPLAGGGLVEGWQRFAQWPLFALLLLLVNVGILGWWGNLQLNADPLAAGSVPTAAGSRPPLNAFQPTADPTTGITTGITTGADSEIQLRINVKPTFTPTATVAMTGNNGTLTIITTNTLTTPVTLSALAPPSDLANLAVVTLAPEQLQITPTPAVSNAISQSLFTATPAGIVALPPIVVATPLATPASALAANGTPTATVGSLATPTAPLSTAVTAPAGAEAVTRVQSPVGANVRAAPATTAAILTLLPDQSALTINGRTADSSWLAIRLADGVQGWIAATLVAADPVTISVAPVLNP